MPEKLPFTINELVENPWDEIIVYRLNEDQKKELLNNKALMRREYMFNKGTEWKEHSHNKPQLILLIEGELVHMAKGEDYIQNPNDLLIVPADLLHTAHAKKDLVLYWFTKHK